MLHRTKSPIVRLSMWSDLFYRRCRLVSKRWPRFVSDTVRHEFAVRWTGFMFRSKQIWPQGWPLVAMAVRNMLRHIPKDGENMAVAFARRCKACCLLNKWDRGFESCMDTDGYLHFFYDCVVLVSRGTAMAWSLLQGILAVICKTDSWTVWAVLVSHATPEEGWRVGRRY